jgi:hypothetical protein
MQGLRHGSVRRRTLIADRTPASRIANRYSARWYVDVDVDVDMDMDMIASGGLLLVKIGILLLLVFVVSCVCRLSLSLFCLLSPTRRGLSQALSMHSTTSRRPSLLTAQASLTCRLAHDCRTNLGNEPERDWW